MKYLSSLLLGLTLVATLGGCCHHHTVYTVPAGYHTCRYDRDCKVKNGEYCGFQGVDTYPVCKGAWK